MSVHIKQVKSCAAAPKWSWQQRPSGSAAAADERRASHQSACSARAQLLLLHLSVQVRARAVIQLARVHMRVCACVFALPSVGMGPH